MFNKLMSRLRKGRSNLIFHEAFGFQVNDGQWVWTPNRVVDQGLNYVLNAALRADSVLGTWYIAPYASNTTPAANVTAANFASGLTEFTNYTETNRVTWTPDGAATALSLVNDAAPALFTIGSGGQTSIYGAGLLSAQAKSATSGVCFAAGRLSGGGSLLNLQEGYEVRIKYRITASSS